MSIDSDGEWEKIAAVSTLSELADPKKMSFLEKIPNPFPAWAERLGNEGFTAYSIECRQFRRKTALGELIKGDLR
jgi:hypothetical protein